MNEAWKQWAGQVANGRFPLQQYLGGSEQSVVYLTERPEQRTQKAAIKFIPESSGAEEHLSRWGEIAALSHPHLLRLFESGRCQMGGVRLLYVVMEFAEESLSQILPERALKPNEVRAMLVPILSALQYLHAKGFIHARLKPSNILAAGDEVKLSSDELLHLGETVHQPGSGNYDAPEASHEPLSPASDMWALGLTIVEVLTQRPLQTATQTEPAVPPALPSPFQEIAQNCLRLYPQRRWTLSEIQSALSGPLPSPHPQARAGTTLKWRYALLLAAIVAVLAALLIRPRLGNSGAEAPLIRSVKPEAPSKASGRDDTSPSTPNAAKPDAGKGGAPPSTSVQSPNMSAAPEPSPGSATPEEPGGGVVHRVIPNVPLSARNTITGKVRVWVRVTVDSSGNVVGTTFDREGPSKYFARLAKQAAEGWKFTPAQASGETLQREWVLRFQFGRESTEVFPAPAAGPPATP
jgi:serine/threonine protein kinase